MDEKMESVEKENEAEKVIEKVKEKEVEEVEEGEDVEVMEKEKDSKSQEDSEEATRRVSPRLRAGLGRKVSVEAE